MEENYKNREIDQMFKTLENKMEEKHNDLLENMGKLDGKMDKLLTGQSYTNGKVMKHDIWGKAFWWFFGFIGTLIILSVPIFKYILLTEIHKTSQEAVKDTLSEELEPAITSALQVMFSEVEVVK